MVHDRVNSLYDNDKYTDGFKQWGDSHRRLVGVSGAGSQRLAQLA